MKKMLVSKLLIFVLGFITAIGIVVVADTLNASEIDYRDVKVSDALDTLYQKSSYAEYDGNTIITPSTTQQILSTTNKLLKNDITINPIPSSYKDITDSTVSANTILNGYKAYTSDGTLVTGNLSTNCVSGIYTKTANNQAIIDLGFVPSKISLVFTLNDSNRIATYDASLGSDFYVIKNMDTTPTAAISTYFLVDGHYLKSNTSSAIQSYQSNISYMACK